MNNNDLNNDEIRRQLRAVDRMNTAVVPRSARGAVSTDRRRQLEHRREGRRPRRSVAEPP